MEEEYNKGVEKEAELLKGIINDKKQLSMLRPLLKIINSEWSSGRINDILNNLSWDDQKGTWRYIGKGEYHAKVTTKSADTQTQYHRHIDTLVRRCNSLKSEINTYAKETEGAAVKEYIIELDDIQNKLLTHKNIKNQQLSIQDRLSLAINKGYLGELTIAQAKTYYEKIDKIRDRFLSVKDIQQRLEWALAEILGGMVANDVNKIAKNEFKKLEKDLMAGKKYTTPMRNNSNGSQPHKGNLANVEFYLQNIDMDLLAEDYLTKDSRKGATAARAIKNKDGSILRYEFRTITGAQQKSDIILTMQEEKVGLSMKNTLLEEIGKENSDQSKRQDLNTTNTIHLQSSTTSLLTYLQGIQLQKNKLGTHYLNILSNLNDVDTTYTQMRNEANNALTLAIVYSALTGQHQGRRPPSNSVYASVLAVYDKTSKEKLGEAPRIRLFDMSDIIGELAKDSYKRTLISPSIDSISLSNTEEGNALKAPSRESAYRRVDKLLIEAGRKNLAVSISKQFLNSLY